MYWKLIWYIVSRLFLNLYAEVSLLLDWFERCIVVSLLLEKSCCVEIGSSNSSRCLKVLHGTTQSVSSLHMRNNVSHANTNLHIHKKKHPFTYTSSHNHWSQKMGPFSIVVTLEKHGPFSTFMIMGERVQYIIHLHKLIYIGLQLNRFCCPLYFVPLRYHCPALSVWRFHQWETHKGIKMVPGIIGLHPLRQEVTSKMETHIFFQVWTLTLSASNQVGKKYISKKANKIIIPRVVTPSKSHESPRPWSKWSHPWVTLNFLWMSGQCYINGCFWFPEKVVGSI